MKLFNYFGIFVVAVSMLLTSCGTKDVSKVKVGSSELDSMSYAIGIIMGDERNLPKEKFPELNYMAIAKGFADARDTSITTITNSQAQELVNKYINKAEIKANEDFIKKYEALPNVKKTATGLMYEVISEGSGEKPTVRDSVKVHYTGTFEDGNKFDSSVDRGEPAVFTTGGVIPGWVEGLQLMSPGAKYKFYIPQDLAYGPEGRRGGIPPYTPLIFEVELIEVYKVE